ncbi:MAG TPA: MYXO-CTERM sorting domain-containing protein, partial [Myxococcaceae bacterium]|nr:MYXO-CTERM sorting domain-containing protein [Myxococcaceae bacterium]
TWGDVLFFPPLPFDAGAGDSGTASDAGSVGADAGTARDGGVGGTDGGAPDAGNLPGSAGGCGCSSAPSLAWAVLLLLGVHRRRRQRVWETGARRVAR